MWGNANAPFEAEGDVSMKTAFFKIFVIAFISVNVVLAAAAMPEFVRDRIVDKIMAWGDKHIGGPFKKGGGDEEATRKVVEDFVSPGNPWEAAWDITTNGESHTATPEQDTPDPSHLAPGAHLQIPI